MQAVAELAVHVGLKSACRAFALNRAFVYRDRAGHRGSAHRCGYTATISLSDAAATSSRPSASGQI